MFDAILYTDMSFSIFMKDVIVFLKEIDLRWLLIVITFRLVKFFPGIIDFNMYINLSRLPKLSPVFPLLLSYYFSPYFSLLAKMCQDFSLIKKWKMKEMEAAAQHE